MANVALVSKYKYCSLAFQVLQEKFYFSLLDTSTMGLFACLANSVCVLLVFLLFLALDKFNNILCYFESIFIYLDVYIWI